MGQLIGIPTEPPNPNWLAEHMAHVALITLNFDDDGPLLTCEREQCKVPLRGSGRMVWWEVDVYGLTPEQLVEVRDKHLRGELPSNQAEAGADSAHAVQHPGVADDGHRDV